MYSKIYNYTEGDKERERERERERGRGRGREREGEREGEGGRGGPLDGVESKQRKLQGESSLAVGGADKILVIREGGGRRRRGRRGAKEHCVCACVSSHRIQHRVGSTSDLQKNNESVVIPPGFPNWAIITSNRKFLRSFICLFVVCSRAPLPNERGAAPSSLSLSCGVLEAKRRTTACSSRWVTV